MPTNLELKIKLVSFIETENILRESSAIKKGLLKQKDVYYKFKKGLLKLRVENGKNYLIKYLRDEKGKRWSNYDILNIEGKNVEKYLSELFEVETVVDKKRKLFLIGDTRVHLDDVKNLGKYLELETVVTKNKKKAEKEFNYVVKLLKLNLKKQLKTSYRSLIKK